MHGETTIDRVAISRCPKNYQITTITHSSASRSGSGYIPLRAIATWSEAPIFVPHRGTTDAALKVDAVRSRLRRL